MQYERLVERAHQPPDRMFAQHVQTIGDMDFLVTAIRRFLRTARLAQEILSEHQPELEQALDVFDSRWWASLREIRNALEHIETPSAAFPVPAVGIPADGNGDGGFIFMKPGGNLNLGEMYEDARSIARAIAKIIEQAEAKHDPGKLGGQRNAVE